MFFWLKNKNEELRRHHRIYSFNIRSSLRVYHCFVRLYYEEDQELYELDVYDSKPYFSDGTRKYLHESAPIAEWDDEVFDEYTKPIELAREIIEQHEQKDRLENSIRYNSGVYELKPKPRKEKSNVVQIHDYEEQTEQRTRQYYLKDIAELDHLKADERAELFVRFPELKERYKTYIYQAKTV